MEEICPLLHLKITKPLHGQGSRHHLLSFTPTKGRSQDLHILPYVFTYPLLRHTCKLWKTHLFKIPVVKAFMERLKWVIPPRVPPAAVWNFKIVLTRLMPPPHTPPLPPPPQPHHIPHHTQPQHQNARCSRQKTQQINDTEQPIITIPKYNKNKHMSTTQI